MIKISEYLKSNGQPSSTRLFSWLFMWFFFITNIMILLLLFLGNTVLDVNTLVFFLSYDFLLLLAIFAPKSLSKVQEIKELIEITKINGKKEEEKQLP